MDLREKVFTSLGEATVTKYWLILLIGLLITVILGTLSEKLKLEMTWLSMVPQKDPSVIEYKSLLKKFRSATPLIITIEGDNTEKMKKVAEEISLEFKKLTNYIKDVRYKTDVEFLKKYGLLLQKSRDLKRFKDILKDFNLANFFQNINNDFEKEYIEESEEPLAKQEKNVVQFLDILNDVMDSFRLYLSNPSKNRKYLNNAINKFTIGEEYFLSHDKKMLLILAITKHPVINTPKSIGTAKEAEKILNRFRKKYPDLKFGQTGMHTISRDEMEAGTHDTVANLIIAIIIVLTLFIISFRMVSAPFLAMVALLIGIVWNLGITYLVIGKLNLMTAMVGVILIGLGIDYSIHLISGFTQNYYKTGDYKNSFKETFRKVGPGILTGGMTTAVAFLVFVLVKIDMMRELGFVLGTGIICTFISAILILPSLIVLKDRIKTLFIKKQKQIKNISMEFDFLGNLTKKIISIPLPVIIITFLLTAGAVILIPKLHFTGDFKKLEARGLLSLELMDRIIEKFDMSIDSVSFTVNSLKECEEKTEKLNKLNSVGFVESISLYLPSKEKQLRRKKHIIEIKNTLLSQPLLKSANRTRLINELRRLEANIIELGDIAYMSGLDKIVKRCDEIANLKNNKKAGKNIFDKLIEIVKKSDISTLNRMQKIFAQGLKQNYLNMCSAERITLKDIPRDIKSIYISKDRKEYLISVYPAKDIWSTIAKSRFLLDVRKLSKDVTGTPIFMYLVIKYSAEGGKKATLWALLIIFLLVLIDFKNLKFSLISLLPLIIGSIWALGFLVITDFQLTYMTIMIVPLIIGIGIDDGVHIIHRYRIEGKGSLPVVLSTTGKAIVLTSLTTMVAFGSLAFSRMVGYQQFGISLFAGIGFLLILSAVFLPAVIKLFEKN